MYAAYRLTNFSGQSHSLQELLPHGAPTGTRDCCAPKLLHYAATHQLKPLAMAEFWWGTTHQLRVHAADPQGLGVRILGDRLYGCTAFTSRLHLHAREIRFEHPRSRQTLHLQIKTPFLNAQFSLDKTIIDWFFPIFGKFSHRIIAVRNELQKR